jgi:hypothetical protein
MTTPTPENTKRYLEQISPCTGWRFELGVSGGIKLGRGKMLLGPIFTDD